MGPAIDTAHHLGSWPLIAPVFIFGFVSGAVWLRRHFRTVRDRRSDLVHSAGVLARQQIVARCSRAKPAAKFALMIARLWRVHRRALGSIARRLSLPGARPGQPTRRGVVVLADRLVASRAAPGHFDDGNHFSIRHDGRK
jgi:hypothetical protein